MANKDYPHGLTPVMSRFNDTPRMRKYYGSATTAIFRGDIVCIAANGRVHSLTTVSGANTLNVVGVAANYHAAATTPVQELWVYDDADTIFEIQSDGGTDPATKAAAVAHIGQTANIIAGAGSTASGQSAFELDYSDLGTDTTAPLKVVGLDGRVGNDVTLAHARYLVVLNHHFHEKGVTV